VLGFEYGYSTTSPDTLVIWEGQFGDFVNGAQVVIDQFISSGEAKWGRLCGLTMFLPHGYEGQGPEHSSARLERFLQLCAEHNMQVVVPSTPAQMFHLLRRQMLRQVRKPLVVLTPKSLLRHKLSVSSLGDLARGRFLPMIEEVEPIADDSVTRVVFCSGKVYFDLAEYRRNENIAGVALVRIEELYPFPVEEYARVIARYKNAKEVVWCQEEPQIRAPGIRSGIASRSRFRLFISCSTRGAPARPRRVRHSRAARAPAAVARCGGRVLVLALSARDCLPWASAPRVGVASTKGKFFL